MKGLLRLYMLVCGLLKDPESEYRRVAIDFLKISFLVFLAKVIGGAKELVVAWHYGINEVVDVYIFIFNLTTWPANIFFSVLTVTLIPLFVRLRTDTPEENYRFRSEFLGVFILFCLAVWLLMALGLPLLISSGGVGFQGTSLELAQKMAFPMTFLFPLGAVSGLFAVFLMSRGLHRNTFFEAMPALTILVVVLCWASNLAWEVLVWGTVAGFFIQSTCLFWPVWKMGELETPVFSLQSPAWSSFKSGLGFMVAGQVLMSLTGIVDQFFAVRLQPGDLSVLNYANRIVFLIIGLGATAISRACLPVFSRVAVSQNEQILRVMAWRWTGGMFFFGCVSAALLWWQAPFLVSLLFERGAFSSEDCAAVSAVFRVLLLQLPFYFSGIVLVSTYSGKRSYGLLFFCGLSGLVFKCIVNFLLVPYYGIIGIAFATCLVYFFNTIYLLYFFRL